MYSITFPSPTLFISLIWRWGRGMPESSYNIFSPNFLTYHFLSWNSSFSWQIEAFLLVQICSMLISVPALLGCGKAVSHTCTIGVNLPQPKRTRGLKSAKPAQAFPCPFDLIITSVQAACPMAQHIAFQFKYFLNNFYMPGAVLYTSIDAK